VTVVALIPAFNEEALVADTVAAVASHGIADRIIVIDDGSTDDTAARARESGAEVVSMGANQGKGAALDAGLETAGDGWDIMLMLDADLGESASQAELLAEPVSSGEADMSIATFPKPSGKAGFGLVMNLARQGIRDLGDPDFDAQAPLSGQRALNRTCVATVTPFAFGYGVEVALTVRALRSGMKVLEVPTTMTHAATGRDLSGFMHRGRQYVHVRRALRKLAQETGDRQK
jgi:glycosyltransferase involved in cell wall biosynthesis